MMMILPWIIAIVFPGICWLDPVSHSWRDVQQRMPTFFDDGEINQGSRQRTGSNYRIFFPCLSNMLAFLTVSRYPAAVPQV
ncbi:hypothetical protein EV424DRAFT_787135 [Suillus variegatus]|nr:hypothetical protein EV424DRAFT_787135 [Suillus variegatus]